MIDIFPTVMLIAVCSLIGVFLRFYPKRQPIPLLVKSNYWGHLLYQIYFFLFQELLLVTLTQITATNFTKAVSVVGFLIAVLFLVEIAVLTVKYIALCF